MKLCQTYSIFDSCKVTQELLKIRVIWPPIDGRSTLLGILNRNMIEDDKQLAKKIDNGQYRLSSQTCVTDALYTLDRENQ